MELSPRLSKIKRIDGMTLSDRHMKILQVLRRNQSAVLMQLQTVHMLVAYHLHKIQATDTGTCSRCEWANKLVIHYLLHCPVHETARQKLINALGPSGCNIGYLLSHPKALPHTLQFVDDTERLLPIYGHVNTMTDQNKQLQKLVRLAKRVMQCRGGDNNRDREQRH